MQSCEEYTNRCGENNQQAAVTNLIIHVGKNHLPRDHPADITAKISNLLRHVTKEFSNTFDILFHNPT